MPYWLSAALLKFFDKEFTNFAKKMDCALGDLSATVKQTSWGFECVVLVVF